MIFFGGWYAVGGIGLLRKTFYGVLLFYMAVLYSVWVLVGRGPHENFALEILQLVWFGLPAIFCYRRFEAIMYERAGNWPDFNRRRREVELPKIQISPSTFEDEEVKAVLQDIKERRKARDAREK